MAKTIDEVLSAEQTVGDMPNIPNDVQTTSNDKEEEQADDSKQNNKTETQEDLYKRILGDSNFGKAPESVKEENDNEEETTEQVIEQSVADDPTVYDYREIAEWQSEQGILNVDIPEDFDGTEQSYRNLVLKDKEEGVASKLDEVLGNLDKQYDGAIKYMLSGGDLKEYAGIQANSYANITPETLESQPAKQEILVRDYMKKFTTFSDERIDRNIKRMKDLEELGDEVKEMLPELQQWEQTHLEETRTKREQETKQKQEQWVNTVNKAVGAVDNTESFLGISVTPKLANKTKDNISTGATLTKINENLGDYMTKLAMLDALGILDGDISKIENKLTTKAVRSTKDKITRKPFTKGVNKPVADDKSTEAIGKFYNNYK